MELNKISMNLGEFLNTESEDAKEWRPTRRVGCAEYDPETNVINLHVYNGDTPYEVDLDRCTTPAELADWLFHLAGKTWCKGNVLTDFILCLERAIEDRHGVGAETYFNVHESKSDEEALERLDADLERGE